MVKTNNNTNNNHPNNKNNKDKQNRNISSPTLIQSSKSIQKVYLNVYPKELTKFRLSIKYGDSIDMLFNTIICING